MGTAERKNAMTKCCVIGCGVISPNHLKPLSEMENVTLAGVCDVIAERAEKRAAEYNCPAFTDYREMIETVKPDAVHLCLPHALHSPIAIDCLERGIAVLSEKPMDAHLAGAQAMWDAHLRTGTKLGVIFQNVYNSGSRFALEAIKSGRLGKLISLAARVLWRRDEQYYADGTWRRDYSSAGGGVIINQAIHTLDLERRLAGAPVKEVRATVSHHGETTAEVEDTAEGLILFENGVKGLFYFSINNAYDDEIVLSAHLEKGDLTVTGGRCRIRYKDGTEETDEGSSATFCGAKAVYGTGHAEQIARFYEEGGEKAVEETAHEALLTQKLIFDIFTSAGIAVK